MGALGLLHRYRQEGGQLAVCKKNDISKSPNGKDAKRALVDCGLLLGAKA